MPEANDLTITFKQRSSTHGDYAENARIAISLRQTLRNSGNWDSLSPGQQLALDEIALKIARIVSLGAGQTKEHWHDIQGYAKLGEDACV
jgi:hypothetical protein